MRFTEALDRKLEDITRPPNLPIGHYIFQVQKPGEITERDGANGSFEILSFAVVCVEPLEDVDPDELEEYGSVSGALIRRDFIFSNNEADKAKFEQSMFRLRQFFGHLGLSEDMPIAEALNEAVGQQFKGKVKHRPDPNDPEIIYQEIERTTAV